MTSTTQVCQTKVMEVCRPGVSEEELLHVYNTWAPTYDQDMATKLESGAHTYVSDQIDQLVPREGRASLRVLDVGAGTGLLGQKLYSVGFTRLDALDPSREMLEVTRHRNIYQNVYQEYISSQPLHIDQGTYDLVAGVGMLGHNHAPFSAMHEMVRLVKPGGHVVLAIRKWYVVNDEGYSDMEPVMQTLETSGKWRRVLHTVFPNYYPEHEGLLYIFQVL